VCPVNSAASPAAKQGKHVKGGACLQHVELSVENSGVQATGEEALALFDGGGVVAHEKSVAQPGRGENDDGDTVKCVGFGCNGGNVSNGGTERQKGRGYAHAPAADPLAGHERRHFDF
jgi:hypothetical protein